MAEHGTLYMYKDHRCRCRHCTAAYATWSQNRRRQQAYGRWKPYVDAEPARRHVRDLMAFGIGWQHVANLSGVSKTAISMLLFGSRAKNMPPTRKIRPETEAKLLAVTKTRDNIRKWVDAAGSRRRLQALAVLGWSMKGLARRLGMNPHTLTDICTGRRAQVTAATARTIVTVYNELWMRQPPQDTAQQRQSAQVTRGWAQRSGWQPPLAWDDDLLDLPDDDLEQELRRRAGLMTYEELARAHNARHRYGDTSPLTVEMSREYKRRQHRRGQLGEAS